MELNVPGKAARVLTCDGKGVDTVFTMGRDVDSRSFMALIMGAPTRAPPRAPARAPAPALLDGKETETERTGFQPGEANALSFFPPAALELYGSGIYFDLGPPDESSQYVGHAVGQFAGATAQPRTTLLFFRPFAMTSKFRRDMFVSPRVGAARSMVRGMSGGGMSPRNRFAAANVTV